MASDFPDQSTLELVIAAHDQLCPGTCPDTKCRGCEEEIQRALGFLHEVCRRLGVEFFNAPYCPVSRGESDE